jgi:hypothetical protein
LQVTWGWLGDVGDAQEAKRRASDVSHGALLMSPVDIALTVLLAISFGLSIVLLAIVALILEALAFALGMGRRDWESRR